RLRRSDYSDPGCLFLDHKRGSQLNRQYLSRRISEKMTAVGIKNASGHRIRAKCLTDMAEAYDGVDDSGRPLPAEQILERIAQIAGQSRIESLRPYLNNARLRNSSPLSSLEAKTELNDAERRLA